MVSISKLISSVILPPFSIILLLLLASILRYFKWIKSAALATFIALISFYLLSTPYISDKLADSLYLDEKPSAADYAQAEAIVLLGGGYTDRINTAASYHQQTGLPILISGNGINKHEPEFVIMKRGLEELDITPAWVEPFANTTEENALYTRQLLTRQTPKIHKIILITSGSHMRRSKILFEKQGFAVLPAYYAKKPIEFSVDSFIPQAQSLEHSAVALHEWLGVLKAKLG